MSVVSKFGGRTYLACPLSAPLPRTKRLNSFEETEVPTRSLRVRVQVGARILLLHFVHTASGAHPVSYAMCTGELALSPKAKRLRREAELPPPPTSGEVKKLWISASWCRSQLSKEVYNFSFQYNQPLHYKHYNLEEYCVRTIKIRHY
jgi:hypothetical protein